MHRPCCSAACGTLQNQGSNLCLLHCQADSVLLIHQGSPALYFQIFKYLTHRLSRCMVPKESKKIFETLIIQCGLHYSAEIVRSKVSNHPLTKLNGCSSVTLFLNKRCSLSPCLKYYPCFAFWMWADVVLSDSASESKEQGRPQLEPLLIPAE